LRVDESPRKRDQFHGLLSVCPADILHILSKCQFVEVGGLPRGVAITSRVRHVKRREAEENTRVVARDIDSGTHVGCMLPQDKESGQ